jgi:hypothetical protein
VLCHVFGRCLVGGEIDGEIGDLLGVDPLRSTPGP